MPKNRHAGAGRIGEPGHVFDHTQHLGAGLLEHLSGAPRVDQGNLLRRGDDHHPVQLQLLDQGQLDVAGAGGQVDDQHIHGRFGRAPVGAHHAAQGRRRHRAAPDVGRTRLDDEADGHDLHTPGFQGVQAFFSVKGGLSRDAQHGRCGGSIDVGVQQAGPQTQPRQRHCQIDRDRGLAHAALAAGDGDDLQDVRRPLGLGHRLQTRTRVLSDPSAAGGDFERWGCGLGSEHDLGGFNARDRRKHGLGGVANGAIELDVHSRNFQHERHSAAPHDQPANQPSRRQTLAGFRINDLVQRL